jgi:hypothetical protein
MRCASALLAFVTVAFPLRARADDKQQCVTASEKGQELRDQGRYSDAHDAFSACARDVCPALVRHDCTGWLADLEQAWPSVVIAAKDGDGNDLANVQVLLDGATISRQLDGKPIRVDPGQHLFRFVSGSYAPIEQTVVIHASEQNRMIRVDFGSGTSEAGSGEPNGPVTVAKEKSPSTVSNGPPTLAWVFAGVALAGFGTEAYLGFTGLSMLQQLQGRGGCGVTHTCTDSQAQAIRTRFLGADIALGVGLVSAVLSTYFFVSPRDAPAASRSESGRAWNVDFSAMPGGGQAFVNGRF